MLSAQELRDIVEWGISDDDPMAQVRRLKLEGLAEWLGERLGDDYKVEAEVRFYWKYFSVGLVPIPHHVSTKDLLHAN